MLLKLVPVIIDRSQPNFHIFLAQSTLFITPTERTVYFIEDVPLCLNLQGKQIVNSCRQTQQ